MRIGNTSDECSIMKPVSDEAVERVLSAHVDNENGRSEWLWVLLPNGDLILGFLPQGRTYEDTKHDHPSHLDKR